MLSSDWYVLLNLILLKIAHADQEGVPSTLQGSMNSFIRGHHWVSMLEITPSDVVDALILKFGRTVLVGL